MATLYPLFSGRDRASHLTLPSLVRCWDPVEVYPRFLCNLLSVCITLHKHQLVHRYVVARCCLGNHRRVRDIKPASLVLGADGSTITLLNARYACTHAALCDQPDAYVHYE